MSVARQRGQLVAFKPVRGMRVQQRKAVVVEARLHKLATPAATALLQRQHHAQGGVQTSHHVNQRQAHAQGLATDFAVHTHQPRLRLQGGVVPGQPAQRAVGTEAADPAVDQSGETLGEYVKAHAPALHGAGLEVFDQHVSALKQAYQHVAPSLCAEVKANASLVAVQAPEVRSHPVLVRRAPHTGVVPLRGFNLDDLCAMVTQDLPTVRAPEDT